MYIPQDAARADLKVRHMGPALDCRTSGSASSRAVWPGGGGSAGARRSRPPVGRPVVWSVDGAAPDADAADASSQ